MTSELVDPIILRAMLAGQIGDECPFPSVKAAAAHYGVHPEILRLFVRGNRPAEPALLKALGLERVIFYRPVNKTACNPEKASA